MILLCFFSHFLGLKETKERLILVGNEVRHNYICHILPTLTNCSNSSVSST